MRRVVLDTNITIAAFFWEGHPRTVFELARDKKIIMLLSNDMEKEVIRVSGYSKFDVTPKEMVPFISSIRNRSEFVETLSKLSVISADHTDNIFLECAMDGNADYIISGDRHLLELGAFNDIQILKPKDFLIKEGYLESDKNL